MKQVTYNLGKNEILLQTEVGTIEHGDMKIERFNKIVESDSPELKEFLKENVIDFIEQIQITEFVNITATTIEGKLNIKINCEKGE